MAIMDLEDAREFEIDSHTLIHRILKKMRLCESYGIDYDKYIPKNDLRIVDEVLDCCLRNKDNNHILRKDYEV